MSQSVIRSLQDLKDALERAESYRVRMNRPFVVLSYAQSVDGSIASRERKQVQLSGRESMVLTHQIRTRCDAILVGIETVLIDDPQLTVRLVEGKNPQPVILDTRLRMPLTSKLARRSDLSSWVVSGKEGLGNRMGELKKVGATVLTCGIGVDGRIDLCELMGLLARMKINSLMVEGGARVIASFLNSKLVDQIVITISPKLIGGLKAIGRPGLNSGGRLRLENTHYERRGEDLVLWGTPVWEHP